MSKYQSALNRLKHKTSIPIREIYKDELGLNRVRTVQYENDDCDLLQELVDRESNAIDFLLGACFGISHLIKENSADEAIGDLNLDLALLEELHQEYGLADYDYEIIKEHIEKWNTK